MGKANGTWLAISRRGRIANLLNILEPPGSYYETSSSTGRGRCIGQLNSELEELQISFMLAN